MILDNYLLDIQCEEINKEQIQSKIEANNIKDKQKHSFTVRTKTGKTKTWRRIISISFFKGSQVEAGSTTPIYLRLFDDRSKKSDKIRLQQKDEDGHHFQPGSIDEFQIISDKPLNTLTGIEISHTADKYQGW